MIVLARESRSMNQAMLASHLGMTATNLSKIERGDVNVSADLLEKICKATHYPEMFFLQPGNILPEHLSYRKRLQVPQKTLMPIHARINVMLRHVATLLPLQPRHQVQLPHYTVSDKLTPEKIAEKLRKAWEVDTPVIANMVKLLEQKGIILLGFDFETDRVDSRSMVIDQQQPVIFYNKRLKGDRQRFSLAYQLGQLVMHTFAPIPADTDVAHEANTFAAAFLMPAKHVLPDLQQDITLPLLGELKRKWKQSMISVLYRADDLGLLTPNQKRYLVQQFNQLRIRKYEPSELEVPPEAPQLVKHWLAELRTKTKLGTAAIAELLCLHVDEYLDLYG